MLTATGRDRLMRLVALLRENAANEKGVRFNLGLFGLMESTLPKPTLDCRTQACALGLAAISGVFEKEGLTYVMRGADIFIRFNGRKGYDAAASFFEIGVSSAAYLFAPDSYPSSKIRGAEAELYVAQRIEQFVAQDGVIYDAVLLPYRMRRVPGRA